MASDDRYQDIERIYCCRSIAFYRIQNQKVEILKNITISNLA